ncbi:hypothetical protein [Candidatus Neptunochlamydia vexilliferae]|uniref:DUF1795 domain-containing protein n=1 Tax=Candidatus Neptunichlamydia vexilliferae TaxID=1651774 RepID=A0ABS0AZA7_9BACT|nr:hypothetical protein [Candidatus Neptunochlamydia vexilliferae]MBF5059468.1 hypothetical protein [Candidatus Neptunochlamydia vexilliferae]
MFAHFRKKALAMTGAVLLMGGSFQTALAAPVHLVARNQKQEEAVSWKKFHSVYGKCMVSLPSSPEHVKQVMPFPEEGYNLRYDVYVAAHEKKAVYMMLIAQYPPFVTEEHAEMSLESFLNGLVTQNHDNELIFADLTTVHGHKALDFFIQSKEVYFKGRVIMAENQLYLLAMECDVKHYQESNFNHFISSFELVK